MAHSPLVRSYCEDMQALMPYMPPKYRANVRWITQNISKAAASAALDFSFVSQNEEIMTYALTLTSPMNAPPPNIHDAAYSCTWIVLAEYDKTSRSWLPPETLFPVHGQSIEAFAIDVEFAHATPLSKAA